jgi:hypothetical protein
MALLEMLSLVTIVEDRDGNGLVSDQIDRKPNPQKIYSG